MVTPGFVGGTLMEQLRIAWACNVLENVRVNEVLESTPVRGVLSIEPLMDVGLLFWFEGCSYSAMIAWQRVNRSRHL